MAFDLDVKRIISDAEKLIENTPFPELSLIEKSGEEEAASLYLGDNLPLLKALIDSGTSIDLIYIDPPFFSDASYDAVVKIDDSQVKFRAYSDRWEGGIDHYLTELTARLILMRKLLSDTGVLALHLDHHVVNYAGVIMDRVFGEKNFVNEIIWTYKSGGSTGRRFARKHDNILIYSKTEDYKFNPMKEKSYNRDMKPYRFKGVEEFQDDTGWYTMVNMKDVWDIDMVGRTSGERTGYATQKPEKLLKRLIEAFTCEGDMTADFFCGSGSFPSAAFHLDRKVIAGDVGNTAISCAMERFPADLYTVDAPVKSRENAFDDRIGRFDVELAASKDEDGNLVITCEGVLEEDLEDYLDPKALSEVGRILEEDPLSLIKDMSAGIDDGSGVHLEIKKADGHELVLSPAALKSSVDISHGSSSLNAFSVRVRDYLGNIVYKSVVI